MDDLAVDVQHHRPQRELAVECAWWPFAVPLSRCLRKALNADLPSSRSMVDRIQRGYGGAGPVKLVDRQCAVPEVEVSALSEDHPDVAQPPPDRRHRRWLRRRPLPVRRKVTGLDL